MVKTISDIVLEKIKINLQESNNPPEPDKKLVSKYKKLLPGGSKLEERYKKGPDGFAVFDGYDLSWSKRGGQAGSKSISNTLEKAKAVGFKKADKTHSAVPDGSMIGNDEVYVDLNGAVLTVHESYGMSASQNRFIIRLMLPNN